jgi:hypothetical protein
LAPGVTFSIFFFKPLTPPRSPFSYIFQQHAPPADISHRVLDWLEESIDVIVYWRANSPDLSPIEVLWEILRKSMKRINPQTIKNLNAASVAAWEFIPQTSIYRLC